MPRIEKLDGPLTRWKLIDEGASAELIPARGGLVTSFVVDGEELLFMDEATLVDLSKNVRGGVPLLFPFAGKPPPGSTLPQHGFARRSAWEVVSAVSDDDTARLECVLRDDEQTRAAFPYAFEVRFSVSLFDARLMLEWELSNRGAAPMPLHFGIHPYFRVGDKARVRVAGAEGRAFDNRAQQDREVTALDFSAGEVDLHFAAPPSAGTVLSRGGGRDVRLSWTPQFDTLVVWTLPGQPFVCVEPWTGRGGQPATRFIAAGQTERLAVELRRE
ncbi:MAG: aldose epimerase [Myxococcota bacterium]